MIPLSFRCQQDDHLIYPDLTPIWGYELVRATLPTLSRDPGESPRMWSECTTGTRVSETPIRAIPYSITLRVRNQTLLSWLARWMSPIRYFWGKNIGLKKSDSERTAAFGIGLERTDVLTLHFGHVQRQYVVLDLETSWVWAGGRAKLWHPAAAAPTIYLQKCFSRWKSPRLEIERTCW